MQENKLKQRRLLLLQINIPLQQLRSPFNNLQKVRTLKNCSKKKYCQNNSNTFKTRSTFYKNLLLIIFFVGKAFEETGIAQLLHGHVTNDNTETAQPTEKFIPKGMGSIRKHYDLCLLFSPTGCSVANALTAQLTAATENNIKLSNFLSPPLVSSDVAQYIENSIAKYEQIFKKIIDILKGLLWLH